MKTAFAIAVGCLIAIAMLSSFSDALALDHWFPGFEMWKTTFVGVVFLLVAIGGLFHRYHKRKFR
jgi:hypothetical protein